MDDAKTKTLSRDDLQLNLISYIDALHSKELEVIYITKDKDNPAVEVVMLNIDEYEKLYKKAEIFKKHQ